MATIAELARIWTDGLATNLIGQEAAEKFVLEAACEYQAWGFLQADTQGFNADGVFALSSADLTAQTELTPSEWGVIKVLAELLAERESALIQEASRVASHEPYGRSSSEIAQAIENFRNEYFRKQAFGFPPATI